MATLLFEATIKELKSSYTTNETLPEPWAKKPIMKKVLFGTEIVKPTAFRIYQLNERSSFRTWVFGEIEINPDRFNLNEIAK